LAEKSCGNAILKGGISRGNPYTNEFSGNLIQSPKGVGDGRKSGNYGFDLSKA